MTRQPDSDAMVASADASLADANRHSVVQARADVTVRFDLYNSGF